MLSMSTRCLEYGVRVNAGILKDTDPKKKRNKIYQFRALVQLLEGKKSKIANEAMDRGG
jgi:hypothetical protein